MKRKTFVRNIGICTATVLIASLSAVYTVFDYMFFGARTTDTSKLGDAKGNYTVIIDAGHGGFDGGAVGVSGVLEKDINLSIARQLCSLFEFSGYEAVMTRTDDSLLCDEDLQTGKKISDLKNRVKIAEEYDNPLFISIHQNKFPLEKYKGLQVWYSKNSDESGTLAEIIQNRTVTYLQNNNNRKVKQAGRNIFVLHKLQCPAVLVECGFLSNSNEEKLLCDKDYQKKIAFVIFSSVSEFVSENSNKQDI